MKCRLSNLSACSQLGVCLVALLMFSPSVVGASRQADTTIDSVAIGLNGNVRLGCWVPIRVQLSGDWSGVNAIEFETMDGDAVPVRYRHGLLTSQDPSGRFDGLIRIGRAGKLTVRLFDQEETLLSSRVFSQTELDETHRFLPSTTELAVLVGWDSAADYEQLNRLFGFDAVSVFNDFDEFPAQYLGLESANVVVVTGDGETDWTTLSSDKIDSIDHWIRSGGHLVVTGGSTASAPYSHFSQVLGESFSSSIRSLETRDSGPIELLVGSTNPLVTSASPALTYSVFEAPVQLVYAELDGEPILMHRPFGMGQVSVLGLDLNAEPIRSWKDRSALASRALMSRGGTRSENADQSTGQVSHNGYDDISGQLRVSLDEFSNVSFVTFTTVAILVALFILAIGAGDYFFLKKFVGRMEWTWLTFAFIAVLFCGIIFWLAGSTKSGSIELNQVEVIDLDMESGDVHGTLLTHFYSPDTSSFEIELPADNSVTGPIQQSWICWNGLPGTGLGGMQSRNDIGLYRQSYQIVLDSGSPSGDSPVSRIDSHIHAMPMQTASTKALTARWNGKMSGLPSSDLKQNDNTDAINGTFTNPFPMRLDNVVLFYDDWAYVLSGSLDEGETLDVESEMREKTINGYFTRRKLEGKTDINTPWSTTDTSLTRIADMIMFFEAGGGEVYTTLTNDYLDRLDASDQLRLGRAILVGQVRNATTPLVIDGKSSGEHYDKNITYVRAVFPVEPRKSHRKNR